MRNKNTLFYRGRTSVELNFSSSEISSDGSLIMLEKLERDHRLIHYYSKRHYRVKCVNKKAASVLRQLLFCFTAV
ncbi:hypothetical protein [Ichthyobacterium seriolicida]|uniref:hypothetical protein n=1 Tax=Ichthyobacterium seriolicida TaxID=242600 RepID=UPI0012FE08CC|nr:hypothetical protein [Ichthyobacterium seriolicida]